MQKKIYINANSFFLIEDAVEKLYTEDDVILSVVINDKKYFIRQDSYIYEVGHMLKYFSESTNIVEATVNDLGYEYFIYQSDFFKAATNQTACSRDLHEFDEWLAFASDITVLFYKKGVYVYCQITQNDWEKGKYKNLCIAEITFEILNEWKKKLN